MKLGLKNPRYYIESINFPWKYIHLIALLAISMMAATSTFAVSPVIRNLGQDLQAAVEFLPEFQIENQELQLGESEKALYYTSNTFELVIDDSIVVENNQLILNANQQELFNNKSPFALYIFRNNAFAVLAGQAQEIPSFDYLFANPHRLSLFLNFYTDNFIRVMTIVFISLFIGSFFLYWFQMILIASLASLFNARLTRPITFTSRLKLAVTVSLVPLILLEIVQFFIPGFSSSYLILAVISLFIIYKTFMNHTLFIRQIMSSLDESQIEQLTEDKKKEDQTGFDDKEE